MAKAKRRTASRARPPADFNADEAQLLQQLRSGRNRGPLEAYLGADQYRELQALALEAERSRTRGGPRVFVLPGIMGSRIGRARGGLLPDDLLWVDPIEICAGRLLELALPRGNRFRALGVMLLSYLKLKLRLEIAGFDAAFHPFDWRQNIDALGNELHERVRRDRAKSVALVAHSMGGLVSRAAIALDRDRKVARLIMLGTPNFGSFAPVQALRGIYPVVRKIATLDLRHTAEELARKVFSTFPGLHQMLPAPERFDGVDLYDPAIWPADGMAPQRALLKDVARVRRALAPADERFTLIAGVNQETIAGMARVDGSFEYRAGNQGDGTVPLDFALLPGCRTYYVEESHAGLANNNTVASATIDLLRGATTARLPDEWRRTRATTRTVAETELRRQFAEKRPWGEIGVAERRALFEGIVVPAPSAAPLVPDALESADAALSAAMRLERVVVGRRRQRSIEVRIARGSITEASARALVLGIFRSVEPGGAAAAIDQRLNGAIKEFTARRMFSGDAGEMFAMPTGRHLLRADTILFAGLGAFDRFGDDLQQFVAENVVRTFVRTQVEDFATVLWGTNSGVTTAQALTNQLRGYFKGLLEADTEQNLRRITICEFDPVRFEEMKAEIYRLSATGLFADIQVTFDEVHLPEVSVVSASARRAQVAQVPQFGYVIVNQEHATPERITLRSSVLTAGAHACVISEVQVVARKTLERHLRQIEAPQFTKARLGKYGRTLAELTLHPSVTQALAGMKDNHLIVVHDAAASRIPWETLSIDGWFPAGGCGLSRRFASEGLSVAKWSESRRLGTTLDVLLIVNPTGDLPGAELEGARLEALLRRDHAVRLTVLKRREATRARVTQELRSGAHDVLHYAGHAHFDPVVHSRSGIALSDGLLNGAHLASLGDLPALMFFNACESGRVRGGKRARKPNPRRQIGRRIDENVGLAEAFLRGGAANYIGTYWPVGDEAAESFSTTLYGALIEGLPVGEALNRGRQAVEKLGSVDWADYIHYGSYDFAIKVR